MRQRFAAILLGAAGLAMAALPLLTAAPASAQRYNDRYYQRGGDTYNPFGFLFGQPPPRERYQRAPVQREQRAAPADYSKAPPPAKSEKQPTRKIVVLGAGMADWLSYGLEEALADDPEFGVVRKDHPHSGLIHYDSRSDAGWAQAMADVLKDVQADALVMMIGLNDRQSIHEVAEPAATGDQAAGNGDGAKTDDKQAGAKPSSTAKPEPKRAQALEFRSDEWEAAYDKRIDETIAALKKKGVPVVWVGLPPIRGTRSTGEMIYLNDLYRARAERAGIAYVDVWDGFTDDAGHYSNYGPDVEGQRRRLRTPDGVYFTNAGARKLAHYVERELRRVINTRPIPVSLPGPAGTGLPTALTPGAPAPRPLAGPVVPLNRLESSGGLAGGGGSTGTSDPMALRALVKGEAVPAEPGRADNFSWKADSRKSDGSAKPTGVTAPKAAPAAKPEANAPAPSATLDGAPPAAVAGTPPAAAVPASAASPAAIAAPEPAPEPQKSDSQALRATTKPAEEHPAESHPPQRASEPRPRTAADNGAREAPRERRRPVQQRQPPRPVFDPFGFLRGDRDRR